MDGLYIMENFIFQWMIWGENPLFFWKHPHGNIPASYVSLLEGIIFVRFLVNMGSSSAAGAPPPDKRSMLRNRI